MLQTYTDNIQYFLLFHGKICYAKAPQYYVIRTLPRLFSPYHLSFSPSQLTLCTAEKQMKFSPVALRSKADHVLPILDASRPHTMTQHIR